MDYSQVSIEIEQKIKDQISGLKDFEEKKEPLLEVKNNDILIDGSIDAMNPFILDLDSTARKSDL